jgi:hypothetical protein
MIETNKGTDVINRYPMNKFRLLPALLALFLTYLPLAAQEKIDKTVVVVKPYEPTLSDAYKINLMPVLNDTFRIPPSFDYSINSKKIAPAITVAPIAAAKMGPEQIAHLYKSYLKMGLGNYTTPLFDLNVSSLRSTKYSMGLYAHHLSSHGNIKLEDDHKVYAGFSDNNINLYGRTWKNNLLFSGDIDFKANSVYHYGYDQSLGDFPGFANDSIKHSIIALRPDFGVRSLREDSSKLNFDVKGFYQFASISKGLSENGFGLNGRFNRLYEGNWLGVDLGFVFFKPSDLIDTSYSSLFSLSPWFNRHSDEWTFQLGFRADADLHGGKSKFRLYPKAQLEFHVIPSRLIAWFTADGKTILHDQLSVFGENPYVVPGLRIRNTQERININGGLRGSISDFTFNAGAGYSVYNTMPFFVNDSANGWGNYFNVLYDNAVITRIFCELGYQMNEKLNILLKANYYKYTLDSLTEPYHKAPYDGSLTAVYNLHDKIIGKFEVYAAGKRYSTGNAESEGFVPVELKPFVDVNLGVEYRYTKVLSAFVQLNNLTASKYQLWSNYQVHRFSMMVGFTYAL